MPRPLIVRLGLDPKEFNRGIKKAQQTLANVGDSMTRVGKRMSLYVTAPMAGVGLAAVRMAGRVEQAKVAFTTLLGSGEKAQKFLNKLRDFAAKTPFNFMGLQQSSKQMLALGFTAEEVIPTMTAIGDAVSALGGGEFEIKRVVKALGDIRAKGKVSAQEMKQLAEVGISGWKLLADHIGKTIPEAMKASEKGMIDAETGITAIVQGMGGKFRGMMDEQSKTLLGVWSNFRDTLEKTLAEVGADIIETFDLKGMLLGLKDTIESLSEWFKNLSSTSKKAILIIAGIATVLPPAILIMGHLVFALNNIVGLFAKLKIGSAVAQVAMKDMWGVPIKQAAKFRLATLGAAAAVSALGAALGYILFKIVENTEAMDKFTDKLAELSVKAEGLWESLFVGPEIPPERFHELDRYMEAMEMRKRLWEEGVTIKQETFAGPTLDVGPTQNLDSSISQQEELDNLIKDTSNSLHDYIRIVKSLDVEAVKVKDFGKSFEDVGRAVDSLSARIGETNPLVKRLQSQFDNFADTLRTPLENSLQVTSDRLQEFLDSAGSIEIEKSFIEDFGRSFEEVGESIGKASVILGESNPVIKKVQYQFDELADKIRDSKDAVKETSKSYQKFLDSIRKTELETAFVEELGDTFEEVGVSIDNVSKRLGASNPIIKEAERRYDMLGSMINAAKKAFTEMADDPKQAHHFSQLKEDVELFNKELRDVEENLNSHLNVMGSVDEVWRGFVEKVEGLPAKIEGMGTATVDMAQRFTDGVNRAGEAIKESSKNYQSFVDKIQKIDAETQFIRDFGGVFEEVGVSIDDASRRLGQSNPVVQQAQEQYDILATKLQAANSAFAEMAGDPTQAEYFEKLKEDIAGLNEQLLGVQENLGIHVNQMGTLGEAWSHFQTLLEQVPSMAEQIGTMFHNIFQQFTAGVGRAFAQLIVYGGKASEIFTNLIKQMAAFIIQQLIQIGLQQLLTSLFAVAAATETASAHLAASFSRVAVAAYAAAIEAFGIFGIAAGPGIAAGAVATAQGLAISAGASGAATGPVVTALGKGAGAAAVPIAGAAEGGIFEAPTITAIAEKEPELAITKSRLAKFGITPESMVDAEDALKLTIPKDVFPELDLTPLIKAIREKELEPVITKDILPNIEVTPTLPATAEKETELVMPKVVLPDIEIKQILPAIVEEEPKIVIPRDVLSGIEIPPTLPNVEKEINLAIPRDAFPDFGVPPTLTSIVEKEPELATTKSRLADYGINPTPSVIHAHLHINGEEAAEAIVPFIPEVLLNKAGITI